MKVLLWRTRPGDTMAALDASLVEEALLRMGCAVHHVCSLEEFTRLDLRPSWDAVLLQLGHTAEDSLELLNSLRWLDSPPVITLASVVEEDLYLKAMRLGAFDCISLPLDERELLRVMPRVCKARHLLVVA
jgi:DNA-binding response OmpR family regulator